jgi:arylsulfatase A-like enzyme/Tfp pilus assembly protein PilF
MIPSSKERDLGQEQKTNPHPLISRLAILTLIFTLHSGCKKGDKIPSLKQSENFNLLLITVDSLRADRIGVYGFRNARTPNIDRLAENGLMFKNCYAPVPLSLPSHCTIFTGREPPAHGVRNNGADFLPDSEQTWAEVMKNNGFETYALVSSYLLHSKFGLKQGFDAFDDSLDYGSIINTVRTAIAADQVFARFRSWLERRTPNKFFAWVHFSDPRAPVAAPPEYAGMFENDPYSGKVALVDHYIGEMVHALEAKKLMDRTVVVIAGSHGEALHEHREWGAGLFCYEPTLKVPLIIHNPAAFGESRVMASRVRLLDLMPSLLQLFNLESPVGVQGISFLPLLSKKNRGRQIDQPVYFESLSGFQEMGFTPLTGLISENYKYISLPEAELYDLKTDPAEKENLVLTKSELAQKMNAALGLTIENLQGKKQEAPGQAELSRQEKPAVKGRAFGSPLARGSYPRASTAEVDPRAKPGALTRDVNTRLSTAEADPQTKPGAPAAAPAAVDPKKGIDAVERMLEVERLIYSEEWSGAEKELQGIRSDYPDWRLPQVVDYQYLLDKKKNDPGKIIETLRQAVEKYPEKDRFKLSLAQMFTSAGRLGEAEKICVEALAGNPRLTQAYILLGTIYRKNGTAAQVLSCLEKALEQEPQNARLQLEYAARLAELGEKEKSLDILKNLLKNRSLTADPAGADIQADIGGLLIKNGEFEMANTLLLDLVANGQGNSLVWTQIGLGYFNKGNLEKARESLEKAVSLDPRNALALSGMGTYHLSLFRRQKQKVDLEKAITYYTQAKTASPEFVSAINGLGAAFRYAGDPERAIACWEQVLDIDPGFTDIYFNLGITLIETGRRQEALKYLNTCKEKYSDRLSEKERQQLDSLISEIK